MTVHPGDAMSVSITKGVSNQWTISVSRHHDAPELFDRPDLHRAPKTSAEWIQEAPTIGGSVATLADDSNAIFDLGTVNGPAPV